MPASLTYVAVLTTFLWIYPATKTDAGPVKCEIPLPTRSRGHKNTMSDQMPFPFNNFTYFFTLFSKFFSSFHHCTCSLSVSRQYLALDGIYHPLRAAFPNNSTLRRHFTKNRTPRHTGFSPSMTSCSKEHRQGTAPKLPSPNYNSGTEGTRFQI
ncbi:Protein TAR1 domain protein [Saccharomyces cerevisiae]|nr:Protein TAR1 domain protein [Saccharomyces cerevisiae]